MLVGMAVGAKLELDLVESVFSLRGVTLHALQARVTALQGISGCRMFLDTELRRLKSIDSMTGLARAAVGPLGELPVMGIGFVAIRALIESDGFLEVALSVALHAFHLRMLAQQRIFCLRVVEILAQPRS